MERANRYLSEYEIRLLKNSHDLKTKSDLKTMDYIWDDIGASLYCIDKVDYLPKINKTCDPILMKLVLTRTLESSTTNDDKLDVSRIIQMERFVFTYLLRSKFLVDEAPEKNQLLEHIVQTFEKITIKRGEKSGLGVEFINDDLAIDGKKVKELDLKSLVHIHHVARARIMALTFAKYGNDSNSWNRIDYVVDNEYVNKL
ncbi:hypothetical protein ROZALSC1DRAFT_28162 [Rozella allomycis CSF55]|uniref:Uncharacterized protein n=1 Tax=Rozella allomycis (strain CSF55) TaxID=988480 RepID=A0A4P9YMC8_ROZAC|nr:hypothetical protein ROZALSC1DRAFT_28162 [Rozella allomycis CSF55]